MRDVQKLVKHIQKLNGVDKLDLHPPTGFDTLPDVMLVGGNAGHDGYSLSFSAPPPHTHTPESEEHGHDVCFERVGYKAVGQSHCVCLPPHTALPCNTRERERDVSGRVRCARAGRQREGGVGVGGQGPTDKVFGHTQHTTGRT